MGILENLRLSSKLDGNRDLLLAVRNLYSKYVIILLFFFFNVIQIARIPASKDSGGLTLWAQS